MIIRVILNGSISDRFSIYALPHFHVWRLQLVFLLSAICWFRISYLVYSSIAWLYLKWRTIYYLAWISISEHKCSTIRNEMNWLKLKLIYFRISTDNSAEKSTEKSTEKSADCSRFFIFFAQRFTFISELWLT